MIRKDPTYTWRDPENNLGNKFINTGFRFKVSNKHEENPDFVLPDPPTGKNWLYAVDIDGTTKYLIYFVDRSGTARPVYY